MGGVKRMNVKRKHEWTVRGRGVNVHGGCRWGCKTYMVRECKSCIEGGV